MPRNTDSDPNARVQRRIEAFVQAYITNGFNAIQASIAAGYTAGPGASKQSHELMNDPRFQKRLQEEFDKKTFQYEITAERVLKEIAALAFFDPIDIFKDDGGLKKLSEIPENARRAIGGLEIQELFNGSKDDRLNTGYLKKLKIISKEKALEMLGRNLSMFKDKVEVKTTVETRVSEVDLDERIAQVVKAQLSDTLQ